MALFTKKDALDYHSSATGRAGKVEVVPTKPYSTQRDLSLAYTPGVAVPCLEIDKKPDDVYFCTDKLLAWYKGNPDGNIYFLEVGVQLTENSRRFLESLGVRYDLKMSGINDIRVNNYGWYERSVNGFNPDFEIHGLDFSLKNITTEKSVFLWSVLLKHTNKLKGYIETRTNQNRKLPRPKNSPNRQSHKPQRADDRATKRATSHPHQRCRHQRAG